MRYLHAVLHWLRPILAAALIATPIFIGIVWQHETSIRRAKFDKVCVAVVDIHVYAQELKDYVSGFATTPQGKDFVAGLPVPPKPDC